MNNDTSSLIEQTADAAQRTMRRHRQERRIQGPKVVMPGGRVQSATPYLQNLHNTEKQSSTFADIDQHPERYIKAEFLRPGFHYIWINPKEASSAARVRSGRYIEITTDEMLDESELPYVPGTPLTAGSTHKGVRKAVEIYDVRLCAVSPKAWEELFSPYREAAAVRKIASDTEGFYESMENEGAFGEVEVTKVNDPDQP